MKSVISKNFSEKNSCSRVCEAIAIGITLGMLMGIIDYLFISEYKDGNKITHEFRGDASLDDMIENFEYFLKGCGYHFEGHLDIVNEEEEMEYNSSFNSPDFEPTVTFST